jgi:AraC family transcriptional regulator of arabinose operon
MIKVWQREQLTPIQSDYFALNGYGIQEPMPPGIVDRPTGTGDYLMMFFFDPVELVVSDKVVQAPASTLMLWQPGAHQYYGNRSQGYMHSWVHCNGALLRHMVNSCGIALDTPIAGVVGENFEHHLASIHFECTHAARPDRRIVENILTNTLYDVKRSADRGLGARDIPTELLAARRFIETHYTEPLTLPQLAALTNVSPQHFCTRFRKAFGSAPISYLLSFRMAQASYLLLDRNMRVGDVARRVGIDDVYYFSRLFRRHYGKSPRQMRGSGQ